MSKLLELLEGRLADIESRLDEKESFIEATKSKIKDDQDMINLAEEDALDLTQDKQDIAEQIEAYKEDIAAVAIAGNAFFKGLDNEETKQGFRSFAEAAGIELEQEAEENESETESEDGEEFPIANTG